LLVREVVAMVVVVVTGTLTAIHTLLPGRRKSLS
jgi:hypothetical protein